MTDKIAGSEARHIMYVITHTTKGYSIGPKRPNVGAKLETTAPARN